MKEIIDNIILSKIRDIIITKGMGLNELLINVDLSFGTINSIELDGDYLYGHIFEGEDYDIKFSIEHMSYSDKFSLYDFLEKI